MLIGLLISLLFFFIIVFLFSVRKNVRLKKAVQENSNIIENITDAIVVTNENYIIQSWNEAAEKLFGYSKNEVVGERLSIILQTSSEEFTIAELRKIILEKKQWNGNLNYVNKKGEIVYANVVTNLIFNKDGQVVETISIIRDISSLKKLLTNLEISNNNLSQTIYSQKHEMEKLFERISNGFFALDSNFCIKYINPLAANLHKLDINKSIGLNFFELTKNDLEGTKFFETIRDAVQLKTEFHYTLYFPPTNQWFENWIYGDADGVSVYYRDITNEKNAIDYLEKTKQDLEYHLERLNLIVSATNDAIWDWDMIKNEVWGNENYFKLIGPPEPGISNFDRFVAKIHPDDLDKSTQLFKNGLEKKETDIFSTYRLFDTKGFETYLQSKVKVLYNEKGEPYRSVGNLQNVTDQYFQQLQLLEEKEISESLINSLPGLFCLLNENGTIIRSHSNDIIDYHYNDEDWFEKDATLFLLPNCHQLFKEKLQETILQGNAQCELKLLTKEGIAFPILFTGVRVSHQNKVCILGVGINLTERNSYQQQLRELTLNLNKIREEERTRIAREIHDDLGQQLTGIKMELSMIKLKLLPSIEKEKLRDTIKLIDETIHSVRRIATQLRPGILDDLGLVATLDWQIEEFQKRYQIPSVFKSDITNLSIDPEISTSIFRIFQESLTNIVKHSNAKKVDASLFLENNNIVLTINDNGIGFDPSNLSNKKTLGLMGMKERASLLGGSYLIESKLNNGTFVTVIIPYQNA